MPQKSQNSMFFGHLFESGGMRYYYNASNQELISLEEVMAEVLPYSDQCQIGEVPPHLQQKFTPHDISKAIESIEKARNFDDLFSSQRPSLIQAPKPNIQSSTEYATNLQHLVLTLTEKCNLRCRYCQHGASLNWVRSHGDKSMTRETALTATRYFLERCCTDNVPAISFYGGEALLQVEILKAVVKEVRAHPRGEHAHLIIDTNGVLLDESIFEMVVENKMYLQVSLDGPREYHDSQRPDTRGEGTYDRIMDALHRLLELDPTAHERLSFISTVAPPANLMKLDEFFGNLPLYSKHRISSQPNLRINLANLNGQLWPATAEEFEDLKNQLEHLREYYFREIAAGRRNELGPVVKAMVEPGLFRLHNRSKAPVGHKYTPGGNCKPGLRKLHVTVDGRLQPCERTGDRVNLGKAQEGIEIAAVGQLQKDFFEAVEDNCADCWALRLCPVCYAGWAEHGVDDSKGAKLPPSVCQSVRTQIEKDLKLLVRILELPASCKAYLDKVILA